MTSDIESSLEAGRNAFRRHNWKEAFDLLTAADADRNLAAPDLEMLAEAAWWIGRLGACIAARERAYVAYMGNAAHPQAAMVALALTKDCFAKREVQVAQGWLNSAERQLQQIQESVEHGYLARLRSVIAFEGLRDFDTALAKAAQALDIGTRFGDRDLMAMALHDRGRVLVARGQVAEGMALVDEATVAAVSGELGPMTTAIIYCNTITACKELADYRRAGEWSDAAKRWCDRQAISGFPGMCRVYRAGIMRVRGAWLEADQEARRACEELREFNLSYAAESLYELGEVRLRMGDLTTAEDAFRQAHELGRDPQPGLTMLRLTEGKVKVAAGMINRALSDESSDRLHRAALLPAQVTVAVTATELATARSAAQELDEIATAYGTPALAARAAGAWGELRLAEGDAAGSARHLRRALHLWQEVDCPYEAARTRMLLAVAYRAEGDEDTAVFELQAARTTFERLGAVIDTRRAIEQAGPGAETARPPAVSEERADRTFMFTDIVKSSGLVEVIGDAAWLDLIRWHDQTLRALFARNGGEEIDHAGDGFFVAFKEAASAIECAVAIQRMLSDHRRSHGFAPQVRIGLHTATAARVGPGYKGKGVHEAARVGALAEGEQILASRETAAAAPRFVISAPRAVTLKGLTEPVHVVSIEWR